MNIYRFLADTIVVVHFAYVAFVVLGLAAILAGIVWRWSWVRNFWFRAVHLLLIGIVVAESLCGVVCPLTNWENGLREASGDTIEAGSFVGRWAHRLMFIDVNTFSEAALSVCYVIFGLVVLATFVLAPPRWPRFRRKRGPEEN